MYMIVSYIILSPMSNKNFKLRPNNDIWDIEAYVNKVLAHKPFKSFGKNIVPIKKIYFKISPLQNRLFHEISRRGIS